MATQIPLQPRLFQKGGREPIPYGGQEAPTEVAASQTFDVGDLLQIDSSGQVAIAVGTEATASKLCGIAKELAPTTQGDDVEFTELNSEDVYKMHVYHSTTASSKTNQDQIGDRHGVRLVSSIWRVDIENSVEGAGEAEARVVILEVYKRDGVAVEGDTHGAVLVRFLPTSMADDRAKYVNCLQLAF